MISRTPKDPDAIRQLLTDMSRDIYSALIDGSMKAREYFEVRNEPLNSYLAANITRYHARNFIATRRSIGSPYLLKTVNNNGISIRQDCFDIRVLKGRNDDPPAPSKAKRSEAFYKQSVPQQRPLFKGIFSNWTRDDWEPFVDNANVLNLIYCWEADKDYSVTSLQLACPRESWKYGQQVKLFWKRTIDNPMAGIISRDVNEDDEEVEDLNIYIDETEKTGEND